MSKMPDSIFVPVDSHFYQDENDTNHYDAVDQKPSGPSVEYVPEENAQKQVERMKMICLSLRDAAIRYHNVKTQENLEELERYTNLCNDKTMIENIPYVSEVVTSYRKDHEKVVTLIQKELEQAQETIKSLKRQNAAMYKKLTERPFAVKDLT